MAWFTKSQYEFADAALNTKFEEYYYELTQKAENKFIQKGASKDDTHFFQGKMLYYIMRKLLQLSGNPNVHLQYRSEGFNLEKEEALSGENLDTISNTIIREYDWSQGVVPLKISLTYLKRNQTVARDVLDTYYTEHGWTTPTLAKNLALDLIKDGHQYTKIFVNPEQDYVKVFTNRPIEDANFRKAMVTLPLLFPAINNENTAAFAQTVIENKEDELLAMITKDLEAFEAEKAEKIYKNLKEQLVKLAQVDTKNTEREVESIKNSLHDYYTEIENLEKKLKRTLTYLTGLKTQPAVIDDAAINFFKSNRRIELLTCDNNGMTVKVNTPVFNYINKDVEMYFKHPDKRNVFNQYADIYWIIEECFIKQHLRLHTTNTIHIPWNSRDIRSRGTDVDYATEFPNPHLWHFNCFESTINAVNKSMRENNLVMAMNQLIASVGQLTFTDGIVMERMRNDLRGDFRDTKCWEVVETHEMKSFRQLWEEHNAAN